jgi:hypothetical protein
MVSEAVEGKPVLRACVTVKQFTEAQFKAVAYSMCVRSFSEIPFSHERLVWMEMAQ